MSDRPNQPLNEAMEAELARTFMDDVYERHARPFVEMLVAALDAPNRPIDALDLACGVGHPALEVIKHLAPGSRIIALSDSRARLQEFHAHLSAAQRRVIFPRKERLHRLPFATHSVDLAWACMTTRLLSPIRTILRQAMRVLRPGGRFIVCAPLAGSFMELTGAIASLGEASVHELLSERAELLSAEQWVQELTRTGAQNVTVNHATNRLTTKPPAAMDRLIARHLLPLWLGREGDDMDAIRILDRAIQQDLTVTVQVGCISAIRGPAAFEPEDSGRFEV